MHSFLSWRRVRRRSAGWEFFSSEGGPMGTGTGRYRGNGRRLRVAGQAVLLCAAILITSAPAVEKMDGLWPSFRGPLGTGVAPGGNPPIEWSETKNVRWKVPIPGEGHATPIIWKDRIYLLTAIRQEAVAPEAPEPQPP